MVRFSLYVVPFSLCLVGIASATTASDRAECTDQLVGLATCLPYVGGEAKSPTPDCCSGFRQVMTKSVKCLCVLIRDRNDPSLGLKVDVKLALALPKKCDVPTNVSTCPKLLNLPPNSKEAIEFAEFESELEGKGNPTSPSVKTNTTETGRARESHVTGENSGRNLNMETGGSRIWSFLLMSFVMLMV